MMKLVTCGAMLLVVAAGPVGCKKGGGTTQAADGGGATAPEGPANPVLAPEDAAARPVEPIPPPATDAASPPTADAGGGASAPAGDEAGGSTIVVGEGDDQQTQAARALLESGIALAKAGKCPEAIAEGFDKVVALFDAQFAGNHAAVRCGRSSTDALGQGLEAALGGGDVVVLGPEWPEALYYKAYCLVELGDPTQAKSLLQKALELMPGDPMYLCELGDMILHESGWQQAFDIFEQARKSAETLAAEPDGAARSPGGRTPVQWQTRALRGEGYALVELHRLDDAEQAYRRALELDPSDEQAKKELDYISEMRTRGTP
ncbi:MAG: tetratricopeptide repeat protein [Deltaproteobacteria bacterium]|nr:tetratricopeptide repeat protein [Deltaproteobacteria bacterium]